MLDTATVQWMNAGPPDSVQTKLSQARELLQRGMELADAPLRMALVGEFNSGKTLLLNSVLDSTDIFPSLLQPTTGNVLEVRVSLRAEERPAEIKKATISFFNQFEVDNILDAYLKDLRNQGLEGLPTKVGMDELDKLEKLLCKKFQELSAVNIKYAILAAIEYIICLNCNRQLVCREERISCSLPIDLIPAALTLSARPDLSKGIQSICSIFRQMYEKTGDKVIEKVSSSNLKSVFPMVRRVVVDVSAWHVPFGLKDADSTTLAFLDFPGLGAEGSSARDTYLCMTEIRDAHAVLILFNGSNPGGSGASIMTSLFQKAGKLSIERTIVVVNRFDEFHPLPSEQTVETYYAHEQEGTTVGFSTILVPAKNLLSSSKLRLYICSALCYLFDEKSRRPNWNFGNAKWFNDSKRQAAYTLYKRCQEDFGKLIHEVSQSKTVTPDHKMMKAGLERYLDGGGVPQLRQDLVAFAKDRGEKLIREDALKEIRNAYHMLDEVAPEMRGDGEKPPVNPEISFAAQEFYRMLELAVADTLPNGPSNYKQLKMKMAEEDLTLWDIIEEEIAANITSWPEWFAILNQSPVKTSAPKATDKPQKQFSRYKNIKKQAGTVPTEFRAFDERFRNTAKTLTTNTLERIAKAVLYSLQRFEQHPDYRDAVQHLQTMMPPTAIQGVEEGLPLLDVWEPSHLGEQDIVPIILERIQEEVESIDNLSCPYDGSKPCFWNLALIIRIQVQLMKTYRDRLSRLVAAAESNFQSFFCNEILRAEVLPLVRSALNNPDFLGRVSTGEVGTSWESVGQVVRIAVEEAKKRDGVGGSSISTTPAPSKPSIPEKDEPEVDETPYEARKTAPSPAKDQKKPAPQDKKPTSPGAKKPTDVSEPASSMPKATPTAAKKTPTPAPAPAPKQEEGFEPDIVDDDGGNKPQKAAPGNNKEKEEEDFEEW